MTGNTRPGRLWLIPTPLGKEVDPARILPADTLDIVRQLDCFIAENARTARAFLKAAGIDRPIQQVEIAELNEHTPDHALPALLAPLLSGRDVGLVSEAGCPAVADPGAALVARAHAAGIEVRPLIGPSSILLALMASGLGGQRFSFAGYLPQPGDQRVREARELEQRSARWGETILLIETPYRNQALLDSLLGALMPTTRVLIASDLSLPGESIRMKSVSDWRHSPPVLARTPTVFGLLAAARRKPDAPGAQRKRGRSDDVRRV